MRILNETNSRSEFANKIKVSEQKLTYLLYKIGINNCYKTFDIPKKNGGVRSISAPIKDLKYIQKQLAKELWTCQQLIWEQNNIKPNISHAFIKNKSIITNAHVHRKKRYVINIDLKDFFSSIHFGRVRGFFEKNKHFELPINVATLIAQLTCYNGVLPQGAPTSPIISNLICNIMDFHILKIAKNYKLDYTRYADDLTFSTNDRYFLDREKYFYYDLKKEIDSSGFKINSKKTRILYKGSRQTVTGLTVNHKINVPREYFKNTRAMANSLYKYQSFKINGEEGTIGQLEGRFSFINQLDWYHNKNIDKSYSKNNSRFKTMNSRERQYRKFIFYKYFFANSRPLIITEGKTDSIYLKSALKRYYQNYPNLIEPNLDGSFNFKISFLNKSRRLEYFLDIHRDGVGGFNKIYNYYHNQKGSKNEYPHYIAQFRKITGKKPANPVFLLFDNEMSKGMPLAKFCNHAELNEKKEEIKEKLSINITDNLFLLIPPSIDNQDIEIEDLFDDSVLSYEIDGKKFNRKNNPDPDSYYGKTVFSQHIAKNFKSIDFSKFIPLLDKLSEITTTY